MATREGTKPNEDGICIDIVASMATVDEYTLMIYCTIVEEGGYRSVGALVSKS